MPVKQAGMALPDPTQTAPANWQASCVITGHLVKGLARGYFPEPTKSILVVSEQNVPRAKEYFRWMGRQVLTGSRHLEGYVEERDT